ncbi:MAG: hypothetical protein ACMG6H_15720, partial [Acidobacteriota bacterium]
MKRQMILRLMMILLCATSYMAQSRSRQPMSTSSPNAVTDIRKVDFRNFNYHSSLCSKEYGRKGIRPAVRVSNGEFKNRNVYFAVTDDKIIYADVTSDGREDAIVPVACGATGANFNLSEIYVYTIQDGRVTFLAGIDDK